MVAKVDSDRESAPEAPVDSEVSPTPTDRRRGLVVLGLGTLATLLVGGLLLLRQELAVNRTALAASPRPVTVFEARAAPYRASRTYVGAVQPWIEADVGPQFVSAYVETVRVRPGARVSRGEVLATLDCSHSDATTRAIAMQAKALAETHTALAADAARHASLLAGGFAAVNEVQKKLAQSAATRSELLSTRARLDAAWLYVRDCVLRAPFDGEIATRSVDPGAFVQPGSAIVSEVDRRTVRVVVDAPEKDFDFVAPGTVARIRMLATGERIEASISRRAPKADSHTRTVHLEIDVPDAARRLPVGTTTIVDVDVGEPTPATVVPVYAATQHGDTATLFVVERGVAHEREVTVLGERAGRLFVDPKQLPEHALVVIEGRALLGDGDSVRATVEESPPPPRLDAGTRGGGFGGPL